MVDSRQSEDGSSIRRRRECEKCFRRFTTFEKADTVPLMVIKKDKTRQLFDADKLDAAGALGTARMLLYHGAAGDPIYEVRADGQVSDGVGDAQRNYFYEYHGMIAQMAGSMLTPAGRRMAQARAQTALQLYQAIYDEAQGCHLALRQALDDAFS